MTTLPTLPLWKAAHFDGSTYEADKDQQRLAGQLGRVFSLMRDGQWRTLGEISGVTGDVSDAAVSARLRDLRKERFGGHQVERRRRDDKGLFEYRVIVNRKTNGGGGE